MVYSRYTGASGATCRTRSRTSRPRLAARALPDDRGIAAEPALPELVADYHDPIAVVSDRQAPELRPDAERRVELVGREDHRNALDALAGSQRRGAGAEDEDAVEQRRSLLLVEV